MNRDDRRYFVELLREREVLRATMTATGEHKREATRASNKLRLGVARKDVEHVWLENNDWPTPRFLVDYLKCRKTCSMDAFWRFMGFQTYPSPTPSVVLIATRNENHYNYFRAQKLQTDVMVYFERPEELEDMLLQQFYETYTWSAKRPTQHAYNNAQVWEIDLIANSNKVYIISRQHAEKPVIRLDKSSSQVGEEFHIRLLFKHKTARCYQDLRTIDGHLRDTYTHAAIALGLVQDFNVLVQIFDEMVVESEGRKLRTSFAILTLNGYPTRALIDNDDYLRALCSDYLDAHLSLEAARNKFLLDLQQRLDAEGRSLQDYEFPLPRDETTLLDRERLRFDHAGQAQEYAALLAAFPNTEEQTHFIDSVQQAILGQTDNSPAKLFCLQGSGGTGKSNTMLKILAWLAKSLLVVLPRLSQPLSFFHSKQHIHFLNFLS